MEPGIEHYTSKYVTNVTYPDEFYEALDRCADLHDAFEIAVQIGKRYQANEYLLAKEIYNYLKPRMSRMTLYRWLKPLTQEWREKKRMRALQEIMDRPRNINNNFPYKADLRLGDFLEHSKSIQDGSIDLIFTDPPYDRKSLYLYEELGHLAYRVLREGGSLVTLAGTYNLPSIIELVRKSGLIYWWIFCVKYTGQHARMFQRHIFVHWKPLLWFVKGDIRVPGELVADYIESKPPKKIMHKWEQSVVEAKYIIENLTLSENQIVFDPFMGSGTTGEAALELKRKFIGIEKDAQKFEIAKRRLAVFL